MKKFKKKHHHNYRRAYKKAWRYIERKGHSNDSSARVRALFKWHQMNGGKVGLLNYISLFGSEAPPMVEGSFGYEQLNSIVTKLRKTGKKTTETYKSKLDITAGIDLHRENGTLDKLFEYVDECYTQICQPPFKVGPDEMTDKIWTDTNPMSTQITKKTLDVSAGELTYEKIEEIEKKYGIKLFK